MGTVQLQPYLPNTAELAGLVQSNDAGYEWQSHFTKGCQALGAHSANQTTLRCVMPVGWLHKPRIREDLPCELPVLGVFITGTS